jgi:ATP-dependent DNA helicase RecG
MTRDIPERESLTIEFKSDRARLADRDIIAAVICLANTEGGEIYLGVEDDRWVTGLHPVPQNLTGLTALIANLTGRRASSTEPPSGRRRETNRAG